MTVLTDDDVAVDRSEFSIGRRGVPGTVVVEKMLGAAAERGDALAALAALAGSESASTAQRERWASR